MISWRNAQKFPWMVLAFASAGSASAQIPRFEDYPAPAAFVGKPAEPRLTTPEARRFRTVIRNGVKKGWGVYRSDGRGEGAPGPNFAGRFVVILWGCGAPCLQMAVVDAQTGEVFSPPITADGIGKPGFDLPLLTLGSRVSRNPDVDFRLDSRLMIIRATPHQTATHPSYEYHFLRTDEGWLLLKRIPLRDDTPLRDDP